MKYSLNFSMLFISVIFLFGGCKSDYHKLVDSEMGKNIRQDSLFLGLQFGMSDREFFAHCWELNKAGIVTNGHSNTSVLYTMELFGKKYEVNFYPSFYENKIVSLPIDYSYAAYAPWNPKYSIDTLFEEVVLFHMAAYGEDFLTVSDPKRGMALVRVDGNRRLSIFKSINKNAVTALFKDLSIELEEVNTD